MSQCEKYKMGFEELSRIIEYKDDTIRGLKCRVEHLGNDLKNKNLELEAAKVVLFRSGLRYISKRTRNIRVWFYPKITR